MKWTIDRFEGDFAVVECGDSYFNIPKNSLPEGVAEGDVLDISLDITETENKKAQLKGRIKKLFGE